MGIIVQRTLGDFIPKDGEADLVRDVVLKTVIVDDAFVEMTGILINSFVRQTTVALLQNEAAVEAEGEVFETGFESFRQ